MSQDRAEEPKSFSTTSTTVQGEEKEFTPKSSVITGGTKRGEKKIVVKSVVTNITTYTIEFDDTGAKETKETTQDRETVTTTYPGGSTPDLLPVPTSQPDSTHVSDPGSQPESLTEPSVTQPVDVGEDKERRQEVSAEEQGERKRDLVNVVDKNQTLPAVRSGAEKGKFHDHGPDPPKGKPVSHANTPPGPSHEADVSDSSSSERTKKARIRTKSEQLRYHNRHHVKVHRNHHEGHTRAAKTSPSEKSAPPAATRPDVTSASSSGGSESSVTSVTSEPSSPPRSKKKRSQDMVSGSRNQRKEGTTRQETRVGKEGKRKAKRSSSSDHPSLDL